MRKNSFNFWTFLSCFGDEWERCCLKTFFGIFFGDVACFFQNKEEKDLKGNFERSLVLEKKLVLCKSRNFFHSKKLSQKNSLWKNCYIYMRILSVWKGVFIVISNQVFSNKNIERSTSYKHFFAKVKFIYLH